MDTHTHTHTVTRTHPPPPPPPPPRTASSHTYTHTLTHVSQVHTDHGAHTHTHTHVLQVLSLSLSHTHTHTHNSSQPTSEKSSSRSSVVSSVGGRVHRPTNGTAPSRGQPSREESLRSESWQRDNLTSARLDAAKNSYSSTTGLSVGLAATMQLQPTTVCVRSGWTDAAKDNITYRYDGSYAPSQRSALTDHRQGRTLRASLSGTLPASLSGTFLQTLPDLVTPLKGHSLSPKRKDVVNQCLEFGKDAAKADNIAIDHDGSHVLSVDAIN